MGQKVFVYAGLILAVICCSSMAQSELFQPESVEYDADRDRYFASNFGNGKIVQVAPDGSEVVFNNQLFCAVGMHIRGDTLFVASNYGLFPGLVGFDLTGDTMAIHIPVPGQGLLNDVTSDTSGFVYVTDYNNHLIYKIDVANETVSNFITTGLNEPNGIKFDPATNRVLFLNEQAPGAPVCAINLDDSTFTQLVSTGLGTADGLARDTHGNWYISDWNTNSVYRYNSEFTSTREIVSLGHAGPADIYFDTCNSILVVPNLNRGTVDFVEICFGPKVMTTGFNDAVGGNGDLVLEGGESVEVVLEILNQDCFDYTDVTVQLSSPSPVLSFDRASVNFGQIGAEQVADNSAEPFTFTVATGADPQMASFEAVIDLTCDFGTKQTTIAFDAALGEASILLVDDTRGNDPSGDYIRESLLTGDRLYDHYVSTIGGPPTQSTLDRYDMVLWFTGNWQPEALSTNETGVLTSYLDNGGNLLLTGQGLAAQLGDSDPAFLNNHLHSEYLRTQHYPYYVGVPTGTVFDASDTISVGGPSGAANQTVMDHIGPFNGGVAELQYYGMSDWGAISYDGDYRTVFFSFGLEAITVDVQNWTNREVVIEKALNFLDWLNPNHCCVVPGDIDFDGAGPNIADLVFLVTYMFQGGSEPICMQTADIDGSGEGPNISDLVYMVTYMFQDGTAPPPCI